MPTHGTLEDNQDARRNAWNKRQNLIKEFNGLPYPLQWGLVLRELGGNNTLSTPQPTIAELKGDLCHITSKYIVHLPASIFVGYSIHWISQKYFANKQLATSLGMASGFFTQGLLLYQVSREIKTNEAVLVQKIIAVATAVFGIGSAAYNYFSLNSHNNR